jgi:glycosyltransferase involved in cell wall biosynthesis
VHYNMPLTAALYSMLGAGALPPTVAWVHDICRYVNPHSGFDQRFGFPWNMLRKYHPEIQYEAVSVRRQQMLADTLAIPSERIGVIPNGVAPETLLALSDLGKSMARDFRLYDADLILLMPVRVTRAKNIEFALAVTAALKHAGQKVRLLVTGPPDPHSRDSQEYYEQLLAQRRALGVEQEAVFLYEGVTGHPAPLIIELAGVAELYRLADIVLMPSLREGFGLPVLEAGLTRLAVFTTGIPAVDEVGADRVYGIADGESAEQVATRMTEWAERDVEQRLRRRVRQQFVWQAIFERDIEPLLAKCAQEVKEQA